MGTSCTRRPDAVPRAAEGLRPRIKAVVAVSIH